jgi:hypothetical protein
VLNELREVRIRAADQPIEIRGWWAYNVQVATCVDFDPDAALRALDDVRYELALAKRDEEGAPRRLEVAYALPQDAA